MRQITIVTENKVGILADICETLAGAGVNIESISAQGVEDRGVIRIVTADEITATKALEKAGYRLDVGDIVIARVNNRPGELEKIARKLAKGGVDIECVYMLNAEKGIASFAIKTDDVAKANKALKA
ncbi:ACT domain protein [Candidatus Gugararchaeum adminiculabundum]|nr:ACT domain protein [Candidatus Gugararchaeum adminiculabundum]